MPFTDPILGSGGTLIREAIKSPDYDQGVAGWTINADGSAEFNNVVVRGDLVTGPDEAGLYYVDTWVSGSSGPGGASEGVGLLGPDPGTDGTRAYLYLTQAYPSPTIPPSFQSYAELFADNVVTIRANQYAEVVADLDLYGDLFLPGQAEAGIYADNDLRLEAFAGSLVVVPGGGSIEFAYDGSDRLETRYSGTHERYLAGVRHALDGAAQTVEYMNDGGTEIGRWDRVDGYLELARTETVDLSTYYASGINNHSTTYGYGRGFKDANGIVTLQGLISNSGSSKGAGATLLTLPSALRPTRRQIFTTTHSNTTNNVARIEVYPSGIVTLPNNGLATGAWLSLAGLTYATYE